MLLYYRLHFPLWCMRFVIGVCGKKNYIAPEVLANSMPFNPQFSDLWSIGMCHECVTVTHIICVMSV